MALYNFHRVLISAAILFFFGFGLFALHRGERTYVTIGVASLVLAAGMAAYLVYFNYKLRIQREHSRKP